MVLVSAQVASPEGSCARSFGVLSELADFKFPTVSACRKGVYVC